MKLLETKLRRPPLAGQRVPRRKISHKLDAGLRTGRGFTLVSAPAGFGKTTAVIDWLTTIEAPVSWLSLDPQDDDPGRFSIYLIAALQKLDEDIGGELYSILLSGQVPPPDLVASTLVNDILAMEKPALLVLDDFHVIQDEAILQMMDTVIANLPPALHLILITREDPPFPLYRYRANNRLTEVRAADLRFSVDDTQSFLHQIIGLSLPDDAIGLLQERTEGWVVGLQLAGISLRDQQDPAAFIARLSGSHRYILDYLTEEVLRQQPADVQQFLLQISILDRFNDELSNAVSGRADSATIIQKLSNANLFLIPLDDELCWFRFHHLFADLLRTQQKRLGEKQITDCHRRASSWFGDRGMVSEAIQHAIAAEDFVTAIGLIEEHALEMLMQWHARTIRMWLRAIPPEMGLKNPRTNFAFAWMHLLSGDFQNAVRYIERLQQFFAKTSVVEDPALQAEWLAMQALMLNAQGQAEQSLALAQRALELVPPDRDHIHSLIYMSMGEAYQQVDDHAAAMDAYEQIIRYGQAAGNPVTEAVGVSGLGLLTLHHGQLQRTFEITMREIERIERSGVIHPVSAAVVGELGVVHYHWFQLDDALSNFLRSMQISKLSGYSDAELFHGVIISRLHEMRGDQTAASAQFEKVLSLMKEESPAAIREEIVAQQVRICLMQGDLAAAENALREHGFRFDGDSPVPEWSSEHKLLYTDGQLYNSVLRIMLYRARANNDHTVLADSIRLAGDLLDWACANQFIPICLETQLLRAQLHQEAGKNERSEMDYQQALEVGAPEGFIADFVEAGPAVGAAIEALSGTEVLADINPAYLDKLIDAFNQVYGDRKPAVQQSRPGSPVSVDGFIQVEPLTEREIQVLSEMSKGLKYQEIADHLFISLNTVRFYVKSIYGKLGVNNRVKAISRAAEFNLI